MLGKKKELEIPVYLFMGFLEVIQGNTGRRLFCKKREWKNTLKTGRRRYFILGFLEDNLYSERRRKNTICLKYKYNCCLCRRAGRFQYRIPDKQAFTVLSRPCYYRI